MDYVHEFASCSKHNPFHTTTTTQKKEKKKLRAFACFQLTFHFIWRTQTI